MFILNLLVNNFFKIYFLELEMIEIMWTIIPCIILIFLGWPRIQLLYNLENLNFNENLTLKVMAHQWYWRYRFSNFLNLEFDSFIILNEEIEIGDLRFLEVDNRVVLPFKRNIRVLTISSDVLHS